MTKSKAIDILNKYIVDGKIKREDLKRIDVMMACTKLFKYTKFILLVGGKLTFDEFTYNKELTK